MDQHKKWQWDRVPEGLWFLRKPWNRYKKQCPVLQKRLKMLSAPHPWEFTTVPGNFQSSGVSRALMPGCPETEKQRPGQRCLMFTEVWFLHILSSCSSQTKALCSGTEAHLLLHRCICLECRDVFCLVQILMLLSQGSLSSDKPLFAEGLQLFPTYHPKSVLCSVGLTKSHLLPTLLTSAQVHFLPPVLWDCPGFSPVDLVG